MAADPTPVFWNRIREEVRLRLPAQQAFDTWFRPLRARQTTDALLELEVPNLFFVEWIEEHYLEVLGECAYRVLGSAPQVQFRVCPDLDVVGGDLATEVAHDRRAPAASLPADERG